MSNSGIHMANIAIAMRHLRGVLMKFVPGMVAKEFIDIGSMGRNFSGPAPESLRNVTHTVCS